MVFAPYPVATDVKQRLGHGMQLDIPVIGILRGIQAEFFGRLMTAAMDADLQALEVTMNTPSAERMVASQCEQVPAGKYLGMGTIRNLEEARRAVDAGAMFLVTPNLDDKVIDFGLSRRIPVIAGAFTPTEVYNAWSAGAAMVKVFPCSQVGPSYIRDLRGPLDHIPLVAVGGVDSQNGRAYLDAGAEALGVGSSLFGRTALAQQDPLAAARNVQGFIQQVTGRTHGQP